MADILCPKCLEPWDIDSLHEVAAEIGGTFQDAYTLFRIQGCGTAFEAWGMVPCEVVDSDKSAALHAVADLLGDDVDGYASVLGPNG